MPPILLSPQAKLSEIGNVSVANADGARCERRRHPVRPKAKSTWGNRRSELPKPITSLGGWLGWKYGLTTGRRGPSIEWRTAMEEYIGLDVSMKETSVSIRRR
jgi:hypothetical protein